MKRGKFFNLFNFLCFCLFSFSFFACGKQCFQSVQEISDRPVQGRWKDDHNYAHPMNPNQCPIPCKYSCSGEKGSNLSHRYFQHDDCDLEEFNPSKFLSMFRNRRLLMIGDSITSQLWTMIACSIHAVVPTEYHITREPSGVVDEGLAFYKEYNFTFQYLCPFYRYHSRPSTLPANDEAEDNNNLDDFLKFSNISSSFDLVIMNIGLHHHLISTFRPIVEKYIQQYDKMDPATRPILLWRETSPQHFDWRDENLPMGYHTTPTKDPVCYEYPNYTLAFTQDFRNRLAELFMNRYHIPIMRIYNVTRTENNAHNGLPPGRNKFTDCTHFCQDSGIFYYMRDLLYNIIPVLTKHREEELEDIKKNGVPKRKFGFSSE